MKLLQAQTIEQCVDRDRLTFEAWGAPVSLAQYLERERRLIGTPWGKLRRTWLLENGGEVVASCESFPMRIWVNGKERQALGLASVYTEPKFRSNGYASELLNRVAPELVRLYPDAMGWLGFSEVGEKIYQRVGFQTRVGQEFFWRPEELDQSTDLKVVGLSRSEILSLLSSDLIHTELLSGRKAGFWPDRNQIEWRMNREDFYAGVFKKTPPSFGGARVGSSFTIWYFEYKHGNVQFLLQNFANEEEMNALLSFASRIAAEAGFGEVALWDDGSWDATSEIARKLQRRFLDDTIPIFHPLESGLSISDIQIIPNGSWL